jgi:DNA replication and repair protein RecF
MKLRTLKLVQFRNYDQINFEFNESLNLICGDNGVGKTALLEAIHYLSLAKSFRTNNDLDVLKEGRIYFQVFGNFVSLENNRIEINLNYTKEEGKRIFFNKVELKKRTEMVGKMPVIILSPGTQKITDGGPAIRRGFIDRIISQVDPRYFSSLIEYKKRIYQRNLLLNQYRNKQRRNYDKYFEAVDDIIIAQAEIINSIRKEFVQEFNPILMDHFRRISHFSQPVALEIGSNVQDDDSGFREYFKSRLVSRFQMDLKTGRTGVGPHLDNVILIYGDRDIRYLGSQGEHKILLVALKIAEGKFIEKAVGEPIIFLLDDLFAMLDVTHCVNIINNIGDWNQIFMTTTDIRSIRRKKIVIDKGKIKTYNLPIGVA